jgi:hypothetical protein
MFFWQKKLFSVEKGRRETVRCHDSTASSLADKVRGEVFAH